MDPSDQMIERLHPARQRSAFCPVTKQYPMSMAQSALFCRTAQAGFALRRRIQAHPVFGLQQSLMILQLPDCWFVHPAPARHRPAMFTALKQIFARPQPANRPAIPAGERVYAIGDIHGRLDLLDAMLATIAADEAASAPARTTLVFLGDLIDRGPDSAGVIARIRALQHQRDVRVLGGNHEEMFLLSLTDLDVFRSILRFGGKDTAWSFGVDRQAFRAAELEEAQALVRDAVPDDVIAWLQGLEDMVAIGDYLFVHAGINPAVPLAAQSPRDLRWIREPFLSHGLAHPLMVVHGHTICDEPEERPNRIGIDTGAYRTGRLTALRLEGVERRFLQVTEDETANDSADQLVVPCCK
jgi:serine/threonine protein phosphatase 1